PGFNLDIEDLEESVEKIFKILVPGVDTLQMKVIKVPFEEEMSAVEVEEFREDVQDGIDDGESWNPNGYACNNAVRSFLYHRENDPILFPETEPDKADTHRYGSGLTGPDDTKVLKGSVTWSGLADNMCDDFNGEGNNLTESFTEIVRDGTETWNHYFDRLQKEANKGEIVVGVVHSNDRTSTNGHIVALVPKSVCGDEQNQRTVDEIGGATEEGVRLPCALEAGANVKKIKWFAQDTDEIDNYKWYRYEN
ncbi:MAG: hypothetical protein ABJP45_00445, partial [Cyclobacteriaceae bacterium]